MSFETRLLNGLNVLAAIGEGGKVVRDGEALGLTQCGVSRARQRLEQQLGDTALSERYSFGSAQLRADSANLNTPIGAGPSGAHRLLK
jgi:hypothetical protein